MPYVPYLASAFLIFCEFAYCEHPLYHIPKGRKTNSIIHMHRFARIVCFL